MRPSGRWLDRESRWSTLTGSRTCLPGYGRSAVIAVEDLPPTVLHPDRAPTPEFAGDIMPIRELQRKYAAWALAQLGGHKGKAAEKLDIDAKTLWKWLSNGSDAS